MSTEPFDLSKVRTTPLEGRPSLVRVEVFATLPEPGAAVGDLLASLPKFLAAEGLKDLVAAIATARRVNPDIEVSYHTDGDFTEILPELIEVGVTVFTTVQPECMDPAAVKREYGDRVSIAGTVGVQSTLPFGTPDEVRREIRTLIEQCGYNGGLIVCPSNLIQPDTPLENILALYSAAAER